MENLELLIKELITRTNETPWLELKHNNYSPEMIGTDISALANSATLNDRDRAYMIWGFNDSTHEIVGTSYDLQKLKVGNQELESWLRELLSSNADFEYNTIGIDGYDVGLLTIYKAVGHTVTFKKIEYIRVGSYTKPLKNYPSLEAKLWDKILDSSFEERIAMQDLSLADALNRLSYATYFDLKNLQIPTDINGISHYMEEEGIIQKQDNGLYAITNLGAILFAKKITDFERISRKAPRVVQYAGNSRVTMLKENSGMRGYAVGFVGLIDYIEAVLPSEEHVENALRTRKTPFPALAIREIIANALIHQDFTVSGTGPLVEVFDNRIEVTNSGVPLVDINRIVDNPPKSRNEKLASLMRTLGMCEECGTGWDRIVGSCELMQLPAPKIELYEESTKVTLLSKIPFTNMSMEEKLWSCYLHACVKYVEGENISNSSLRERFDLPESSAGSISRLIKEAVNKRLIKPLDPDTAPRYMKYIPIWA